MSTFTDIVGSLEGGRAFEQLNDHLAEVVQAVTQHRKVGEITITVKVLPNGDNAVSVIPAIKVKIPEAARAVTMFFTDENGNLLRRDPRQSELPLREVYDKETGELRSA
jgi:flagellar hook assembly protein FlgD